MSLNSNVMPNRSLIIISDKNNEKCKEVIELLKNNDFNKKLQDNMINVMQQDAGGIETPETKNLFRIDLYDFNMQLIESFKNITNVENVFNQILELVKKIGIPKQGAPTQETKQKGGYIDYKAKYKKYKKKYQMFDKIVLGYYN